MKQENYFITSLEVIKKVQSRLLDIIPNGKVKVTFSNAGTKSSKQRGLQWNWYEDIAIAGVGGKYEDTKDGVHLVSKFRFAVSIFQRDDRDFSDLYDLYRAKYGRDEQKMLWFVDTQVSTEDMNTSQMAEYLTDLRNHYLPHGVQFREPEFRGLLDYKLKENDHED